jgi:hypothetical protein
MEPMAVETVDDVTPEWMTAVLEQNGVGATVRSVSAEPVGTGQMGSCYRLLIDYAAGDGPDRGPRRESPHRSPEASRSVNSGTGAKRASTAKSPTGSTINPAD